MDDDQRRAKRRAAIQAISRRTPQELASIREAARFARKNYVTPKPSLCQTDDCKTIVYGGRVCTLCSEMTPSLSTDKDPEIEVTYEHRVETAQEILGVQPKPARALSPVGVAVVCLMIVFSLVAAYAQKHEESRTSDRVVVAD